MFMCISANIERQFEFVQQTWINSPSFNGLYDERDPIFGNSGSKPTGSMTIPRQPVRRRLSGLGGFITDSRGSVFLPAQHQGPSLPRSLVVSLIPRGVNGRTTEKLGEIPESDALVVAAGGQHPSVR